MSSSYRIAPAKPSKSASFRDTVNSFGVHDSLQYGPSSIASQVKSENPIKDRLENWEATQDNLRLNLKRNVYGMHAPMRLLMERKLVATNLHMPVLPQSNIHLDILMGRDEAIEPADVFGGMETALPLDIHKDMEKKLQL
ncbi:hypothetical protein AX17_000257 [Amanita inopinata Kibby_2008]|nr:hypothetical protein AX17_000257 [Amanita inopinata Kibby_2008]